jgi:hypothetical protein
MPPMLRYDAELFVATQCFSPDPLLLTPRAVIDTPSVSIWPAITPTRLCTSNCLTLAKHWSLREHQADRRRTRSAARSFDLFSAMTRIMIAH